MPAFFQNMGSFSNSFKRVSQISQSHCGPAVIEMLFSNLGIYKSQEEITNEAGAKETIEIYGTRIDQLIRAVKKLAPEAKFLYKQNASLLDIKTILNKYNLPVGVEWQGNFEDIEEEGDEEEEGDDDSGHYSVIVDINEEKKQLIMADPYKRYTLNNRVIDIDDFMERWWDTNEVTDPKTNKKELIEDENLLFIIAPKGFELPLTLGLKSEYYPK